MICLVPIIAVIHGHHVDWLVQDSACSHVNVVRLQTEDKEVMIISGAASRNPRWPQSMEVNSSSSGILDWIPRARVSSESTVQYSTVQYSTVQYSTVQYSTVQYSTVQYTLQYSIQYCAAQHCTAAWIYDQSIRWCIATSELRDFKLLHWLQPQCSMTAHQWVRCDLRTMSTVQTS